MAYKRAGRDGWYSDVRTQTGWKALGLRTTSKPLAGRIETMWETLASEHRAWDVLGRVLAGELTVGQLYDAWTAAKHDLAQVRRKLNDRDLEQLVQPFLDSYARAVKPDSLKHVEAHVRWLIPVDEPLPASTVTTAWLSSRLSAYTGKRNTARKVHSSWSVFLEYVVAIHAVWEVSPMARVGRPKKEKKLPQFYELEAAQAIVEWQPTAQRRCLMALQYGGALEVSTALGLSRADVWPSSKEVRSAGTKASTRDRVSRVADWAWPYVWAYARDLLPAVKLFEGVTRSGAYFWHRQAVEWGLHSQGVKRGKGGGRGGVGILLKEALKLGAVLPMHNARHHWAVRFLRAGGPLAIAQRQLGHGTAKETLDTYGPFMPSGADRDHWEKHVTADDARRLVAETGPTQVPDEAAEEIPRMEVVK